MSGTVGDDLGDGDLGPQTLAAEYVMGTLEADEAEAARARLATDRTFADEVRFWERHLFPLTALVRPVPPPAGLWSRIEAAVGAETAPSAPATLPVPANDNWLRFWRTTALASLAVAASLATFVALRPATPPVFAVLAPTGATVPVLVALAGPDGGIGLRPSAAITVAPDRDLQLWSLPAGATRPISLGVLPPGGKQVPPGVVPGTKLLVSLEPKGGSPTGQPTGPVVYGGLLQKFR